VVTAVFYEPPVSPLIPQRGSQQGEKHVLGMDHPLRTARKYGSALAALLVTVLIAFLGELSAAEDDPDFYLMIKHCETSVGFLTSSEADIKHLQSEPNHFICSRSPHNSIVCKMEFPEGSTGQKGPQIELEVVLDVPPSLLLANQHGSDFVAIDSSKHSAVVITRLLENEYAGSKVCHGIYLTEAEMDVLLGLEVDPLLHLK
jgi:hypothetical protein